MSVCRLHVTSYLTLSGAPRSRRYVAAIMKPLRSSWKLVTFVGFLVIFLTAAISMKQELFFADNSLETSYLCTHNERDGCVSYKELRDLLRDIHRHASKDTGLHPGNMAASDVKDRNRARYERILSLIDQATPTVKMKSSSNNTIFQRGYDAGVSGECLSRDYGDLREWPKASVVIPFCENEHIVDILHTVHSIIQRSPRELLKEIILVDDNSTKPGFKELLDNYCGAVFGSKVSILRSNKSLGLIQARLLGARQARGDVIITMDAHMEVQETWLQALLYEIRSNRKTLATAMLDWMKPVRKDVWSYQMGINSFMCVFTWDLGFGFAYPRPQILQQMQKYPMDAFPAPCSVGTIWAIEKRFFTEIGELDEGMQRWGGENLDLPIRTWLFGGRAVQVPCSHAAHVERPHNRDYRYGWDKYIKQNYKRVVEVWFDEYKKHVYRMKPELQDVEVNNLSERFDIKKRALHGFSWFLSNVFPELGLYDNASFGYDWLYNIGMKKCLHKVGDEFVLWNCLGQPAKEGVWLTNDGHMRTDLQYWQVKGKNITEYKIGPEGASGYYKADWITKWVHWKGGPMMMYRERNGVDEGLCMEAYTDKEGRSLLGLRRCDPKNKHQRWKWRYYTGDYTHFMTMRYKSRFTARYHRTVLEVMTNASWKDSLF